MWKLFNKDGAEKQILDSGVGQEVGYGELTTNGSTAVSGSSFATGLTIASCNFVADGVSAYMVDIFVPRAARGTTWIEFSLSVDGVQKGVMGYLDGSLPGIRAGRRIVLAAGSHTLALVARVDAGTGTINTGDGVSAGQTAPAYIRVTKAT